jgi:FAD/FMN-containing dehydrogenase
MPHTTHAASRDEPSGAALVLALREIVGPRQVLVDDDVRAPFETDWTRRFSGVATAVVRPGSTDEVAAVVRACGEHGAAIVPQGGNTGMVGGGVPRGGGDGASPGVPRGGPRPVVVLSLVRLDELGEVDAASGQVTAGAGVTLAALQEHAARAGFDAGLDFGARDSATIGGIVSTDAGGARALRHGTARAHVAGLEAALPDGGVLSRMSGLLKDNAGYDLPALLVGAEGTLGVVTRVRWRLVARQPARVTALVTLPSAAGAEPLLAALRAKLPSLEAADFFLPDGLRLVLDHLELASPISDPGGFHVLLECAAASDPTEALADVLADAGIEDAIVADDTASRARLWRLREGHSEAISAAGVPHKLDVGVPLAELERFLARVPEVVEAVAPRARTILFGHLGDGNVHVNVLGCEPDDPRVDEAVLELVASLGGTISAEHGVGAAKARWLGLVRTPAEVAAMRALRSALDPAGVMNPGVMLPPGDPGSP